MIIGKKIKKETFLIIILFLIRIICFLGEELRKSPASYDYIYQNGFMWLKGHPDDYRLPLYSMLIDVFEKIFSDYYLEAVCCFQLLVSLISIVVLYKILNLISLHKTMNMFFLFVYCQLGAIIGWDRAILTESLSLSLSIFLLWGLIKYLNDGKLKYLLIAILWSFVGTFLRAVFVIYLGCIIGFLVLRLLVKGYNNEKIKQQKRTDMKGLIVSFIPLCLVLGYALMFYMEYGVFTLNLSELGQQVYVVIDQDFYLESDDEELKRVAYDLKNSVNLNQYDDELRELLENIYNDSELSEIQIKEIKNSIFQYVEKNKFMDSVYSEQLVSFFDDMYQPEKSGYYGYQQFDSVTYARAYIMINYDYDRIKHFVNESKKKNIKEYMKYLATTVFESYRPYGIKKENSVLKAASMLFSIDINIYIYHVIILCFVEFLVVILSLIKKKIISWFHFGIFGFMSLTILLATFGTNAEYARTSITVLPFFWVAIVWWCSYFIDIKHSDIKENARRIE